MFLILVDLLMTCLRYISFKQKFLVSDGIEGNTVANNTKENHEMMKTEQHKLLYNVGRGIGRNRVKSLSQFFPH